MKGHHKLKIAPHILNIQVICTRNYYLWLRKNIFTSFPYFQCTSFIFTYLLRKVTKPFQRCPRYSLQDISMIPRPKPQTSCAQSPLNPFYTWCNMLLTCFHFSSVVSIPFVLLSTSSILPLHLPSLPYVHES